MATDVRLRAKGLRRPRFGAASGLAVRDPRLASRAWRRVSRSAAGSQRGGPGSGRCASSAVASCGSVGMSATPGDRWPLTWPFGLGGFGFRDLSNAQHFAFDAVDHDAPQVIVLARQRGAQVWGEHPLEAVEGAVRYSLQESNDELGHGAPPRPSLRVYVELPAVVPQRHPKHSDEPFLAEPSRLRRQQEYRDRRSALERLRAAHSTSRSRLWYGRSRSADASSRLRACSAF